MLRPRRLTARRSPAPTAMRRSIDLGAP
jgi:hypothetical protein